MLDHAALPCAFDRLPAAFGLLIVNGSQRIELGSTEFGAQIQRPPSKLDRGIVSRSVLIQMNQSASAADYERLAQRFLKRMGLSGDELSAEQIATYAQAARGDLREFGTAIAVEGISRGGRLSH